MSNQAQDDGVWMPYPNRLIASAPFNKNSEMDRGLMIGVHSVQLGEPLVSNKKERPPRLPHEGGTALFFAFSNNGQ
jgi:hypothetical protein